MSPAFVRQEITTAPNDWTLWRPNTTTTTILTHTSHLVQVENADTISQCKDGNRFISPGIESVSYSSDGKILNATVWLSSPFVEPPLNDSIDIFPGRLQIKVTNLSSPTMTLENYKDLRMADLPLDTQFGKANLTMVGGNRAYKIIYNATTNDNLQLRNLTFWTINEGKGYDITYSSLRTNYFEDLPVIKKILDSIRFDGLIQGLSTHKGQVYNNYNNRSRLGIEFNYIPVGWKKEESNNSNSITLISPYTDEKLPNPSWHDTRFTMDIALDSMQEPGVTSYRIYYSKDMSTPGTWTWTRTLQEVSAHEETRILKEEKNYTQFYDKGQPYILFSFDLGKVNFPQQYRAVFYITDYFIKNHLYCRLVNTTDWIIIPPPEFIVSTESSPIILRPSEKKDIELMIKSNTNLPTEAFFSSNKNDTSDKGIILSFIPNKTSIPASGFGTSTIHIDASNSAKQGSFLFPINTNISFPTSVKNQRGEIFGNSKGVSEVKVSNLTLSILPPYSAQDLLNNFVVNVVTPLTGIWTFLAGVAAVLAPLIIRIYNKKRKTAMQNR